MQMQTFMRPLRCAAQQIAARWHELKSVIAIVKIDFVTLIHARATRQTGDSSANIKLQLSKDRGKKLPFLDIR
jgi:hypothetical protein